MSLMRGLLYALYLILPLIGYVIIRLLRRKFCIASLNKGILKKLHMETAASACAMICLVASIAVQTSGPGWVILPLSVLPFVIWGVFDSEKALQWKWYALPVNLAGIAVAGLVLAVNIRHEHNPYLYLGMYENKMLALENSLMLLMIWLIGYFLVDAWKACCGLVASKKHATESEAIDASKVEAANAAEGGAAKSEAVDASKVEAAGAAESEAAKSEAVDASKIEAANAAESGAADASKVEAANAAEGGAAKSEAVDASKIEAANAAESGAADASKVEAANVAEGEETEAVESEAANAAESEATNTAESKAVDAAKGRDLNGSSARVSALLGLLGAILAVTAVALVTEKMGFASEKSVMSILYTYLTDAKHILNIYIGISVCTVFFCVFGKGIGFLLSLFAVLFVTIANAIKLQFHNTFFSWLDLLQLKDGIVFAKELITPTMIAGAVIVLVLLIVVIIKLRRPIGRLLKPRFQILLIASSGVLMAFFTLLTIQDKWQSIDVYQRTWENEAVNVQYNGLLVNMLYNLKAVGEINMDRPEGYSADSAKVLDEKFDALYPDTAEEVQPDVILILAESLFDLDGVEGITFSKDLDSTIDAYSPATMISPRFGGYTSAIEFEALTGLSLAYMPNGLTPYTTYFNNPEDEFPCIVREFKKNGYKTKVVHPGLPDFYNRTVVYENFGFDEYHAIGSFALTEENTTENGWLKDEFLADKIMEQLQVDADTPQFLFAITMEGHYVNVDKYAETDIKASSTLVTEESLHQAQQQAQAYYDTDQMIAKIIGYMNNTDRPTLLYVFGDHLPPLSALGELGYTSDIYHKYGTSLVMYGNYKQPVVEPDYITPNQIAAQIMMDSGIEHSSYYDYIYSLRDTYPVLHKEFVNVDDPALNDYYYLQYDILRGNKYLFRSKLRQNE